MLEVVLLSLIAVVLIGVGIAYAIYEMKVRKMHEEARLIIEDYRTRCSDLGRFIINEQLLTEMFKDEFSKHIIHEVWRRLVAEKAIDKDPYDNEWCIRK